MERSLAAAVPPLSREQIVDRMNAIANRRSSPARQDGERLAARLEDTGGLLIADAMDRARGVLRFVQSWASAEHTGSFNKYEMYGLCLITEAAESLIHKAQEELRGKGNE
jgi:hypothetical protein